MKERIYEERQLPKDSDILSALVSSYSGREVIIVDSGGNRIEGKLLTNRSSSELGRGVYFIARENEKGSHLFKNIRKFEVDMTDTIGP